MERLALALLRHLPRNALSRVVGGTVRAPWPRPLHRLGIRAFARAFDIEVDEADRPLSDYPTFAAFFTRSLKEGAREIEGAADTLVSPCDGTLSAFGGIEAGSLLQAKGRSYPLDRFLGGGGRENVYLGGTYLTIYLSPRNYHRVHAPLSGEVVEAIHVPGTLWPVFPAALDAVDGLFVANERLLTFLSDDRGSACVAMVGATCVGRMRAAYDTIVTNVRAPPSMRRYDPGLPLSRGQELGIFEMGSTVVMVLSRGLCTLDPALKTGQSLKMGQAIGSLS